MRIEQVNEGFTPSEELCLTPVGWTSRKEEVVLNLEQGLVLEKAILMIEMQNRNLLGPGHVVFYRLPDPERLRGFLAFQPDENSEES